MTAPFEPAQLVRRRSRPNMLGQVLGCRKNAQLGTWRVRVAFGTRINEVEASDLELFNTVVDMWEDLASQILGPADAFHSLMTYERLRKPPTSIHTAFGSARAKFFPYQFKPLLKFLESPTHRLLIADDVGLGKTIEAGYILREWRARYPLEHVLIVAPARLRFKWQMELKKRFNEDFTVVRTGDLLRHLGSAQRARTIEPFFWITSYESIRHPGVIDLLKEAQPNIDLAIFDEAHRVRNASTNQHRLAQAVADCADSLVFLTATPVQTSIRDLHTLLNLLEPGRYGRAEDFEERVQANRPVVRAGQLVAAGRVDEALRELARLADNAYTAPIAATEAFRELVGALQASPRPSRPERVLFQRAIGDFSLTGNVMSRTRKVEVLADWPQRAPLDHPVALTDREKIIYDAVWEIAGLLYDSESSWGRQMSALMAYRYTASCIPAAVEYFRSRLAERGHDLFDIAAMADELDEDTDAAELQELEPGDRRRAEAVARIRRVLTQAPLPEEDSKLRTLLEAVRGIWKDDAEAGRARRKVIVFSYFKRTLAYLQDQLTGEGIALRLIHGGIPVDEREEHIAEFLERPEIDVLLSSEVGGEGLDLQRASVVVNYDLPWNPMVVEQRIGRVDRIGQESDRIVIINLFTANTVEERIIKRLYDRIDLFRQSIGEIEPILGQREVTQLILDDLRGDLSATELAARVDKTADAARRVLLEAERLRSECDGLLAADQAFIDEIEQMARHRRLPMPHNLDELIRQFLRERFPGHRLRGDPVSSVAELALPPDALTDLKQWAATRGGDELRVAGRLEFGSIQFTVDADVAMKQPNRVEFVQPRHALVQWMAARVQEDVDAGRAFALLVEGSGLPEGLYLMGILGLDIQGTRTESRLIAGVIDVDSDERVYVGEDAQEFLTRSLELGAPLDPRPELPLELVEARVATLRDHLARYRDALEVEARGLEARRLAARRASWEATLRQRVDAERQRIANLRAQGAGDAVIHMRAGALRKREQELHQKLEEFAASPTVSVEAYDIATAMLLVQESP